MCDCYLQCEKILFCPCICLIYLCTYTGEYCCCVYSDSISPSISHDKTVVVEDDEI